jgi:1,4-alpha-glucan branching enzyme
MSQMQAPPDGTGLIALDPWLEPYRDRLRARYGRYRAELDKIIAAEGSLAALSRGHELFGLNRGQRDGQPGVWYREWAPGASSLSLIGDFNGWNRDAHPLTRDDRGVWSLFLPDGEYAERLTHSTRVKVHVESAIGPRDRIPAYIRRTVTEPNSHDFSGQFWSPPTPFAWQHAVPALRGALRVYEAHVGMAQEEPRLGTYVEFAEKILPRIARAGYNAVQLMAIQEHPYYGSFGYQVSSLYAPSSRCGTPEELKGLIDAAHGLGLRVLLDLVHSHAVKNINEGLNHFDGTEHQYFHAGGRGQHPAWDSLCFDYAKWEVLRLLLSNVRYWLEEFRFDGFRFDGVTSMLYLDHGLWRPFNSYDDYFPPHVDEDAITYLQLANQLAHEVNPQAITIAEDVSGMVGMARPVDEGGVGFDYRLAMGIPDYWIKLCKDLPDEQWPMAELYHTLSNRRRGERHVAYAESHDQALVGDKTLAFRLMDADMYHKMYKGSESMVIDRGIALHKMIRLITFALGGEAFLNFMGNEFGHPEWIDFPREGNAFSYKYARRNWALAENPLLRYVDLAEFDRALLTLEDEYGVLGSPEQELVQVHEEHKLIWCRRGPLMLGFNFHPTRSQADWRVGIPQRRDYRLVLDSDERRFGGYGRLHAGQQFPCQPVPWDHRHESVQVYVPARTAVVLA